jgi:hypothetical protein
VSPNFFANHLGCLASQDVHPQRDLQRAKVQLGVPARPIQFGQITRRINVVVHKCRHHHHDLGAEAWHADAHPHLAHHQLRRHASVGLFVHPVGPRRLGPDHDVIVRPQSPTTAQIATPPLVQLRQHIHTELLPIGNIEITAKIAVCQEHITGLEGAVQRPQEGVLAGLLALVTAQGGVDHRAARQTEDDHHPSDREADARLLLGLLRVGGLVLLGVGHRHGGAIHQLDASSPPAPVGQRRVV